MSVSRISAGIAAAAAALLVVGSVSVQAQSYSSSGVRTVAPQTLNAATRNTTNATRNAIRQADRLRDDPRLQTGKRDERDDDTERDDR